MNGLKNTTTHGTDGWARFGATSLLRSRRRGSFLVLVVGTLAMLSIIMIVYVAVGSSDKRASASIERRDRSDEIISLFSDYAAQIVADDAVAVAPDPSNGKSSFTEKLYMREAWDAPVTDWTVDSTVPPYTTDPLQTPKIFRTVGAGDDPWLASTTPTWINHNPAGFSANVSDGTQKTFAKRRDWLHISNIAPDGRFVNLFNLRNNFDARPGTSQTPDDLHMNAHLSLTSENGATNQTAWKKSAPTFNDAAYHNPATFDSWQAGAFRPARGPFKNQSTDLTPQDPEYPPYQWADADGDGFFDSRWFEMVDARDPNNSSATSPQYFRKLLPTDPNYRWVFAARIIDLSALVNVNTAGDSNPDPNALWANNPAAQPGFKTNVIGLNPADIDLRRLLSMRDASESVLNGSALGAFTIADAASAGTAFSGGYSGLSLPPNGKPASQDYTKYDDTVLPPLSYGAAQDVGFGAYESLRATLNIGRPPGRFSNFTLNPLKDAKVSFQTLAARRDFYVKAAPAVARPAYRANVPFSPADLNSDPNLLYASAGGHGGTVTGAIDYGLGFRLNNLLELLTYRSVNDPSVSSTLESALGGKLQSAFATAPTAADVQKLGQSFGPLRENRSLELERENLAYPSTSPNAGQPTEAAMLKSYTDLRQYLTTLSGARPIIASTVAVTNVDQPPALSDSDISTFVPQNPTAKELFESYAKALMPGLPFYRPTGPPVAEIWKDIRTDTSSKELRGMFYGGQGPITALLAAGHMAANFASGAQPQTGTVSRAPYVLVMAEPVYKDAGASLPADTTTYTDWKTYFPSWWANGDRQLNLARLDPTPPDSDGAKLSVTKAAPIPAPAVNIYGMGDATPLLTEVATYTVYRDVFKLGALQPNSADSEDLILSSGSKPPVPQSITVNGYLSDTNSDFMFRVLAVKLHNPYSTAITLSSSIPSAGTYNTDGTGSQLIANQLDNFFYLQIGSGASATYFVLAEVDEEISGGAYSGKYTAKAVTMQPNETILFYAFSRDRKFIVSKRFNITDGEFSSDPENPQPLNDWLDVQLGKTSDVSRRRIQMLRVDNEKFAAGQAAPPTFALSTAPATQLVPPHSAASTPDSTVMLRRAVRIDSGASNDSLAGGPNSILNDQLCDRLRLGTSFTLDRTIYGKVPSGSPNSGYDPALGLTEMYARDYPQPESPGIFIYRNTAGIEIGRYRNYNTRFTIALVEHVARKAEATGTELKPGMLPAWAIDPKDEAASTWYAKTQFPAPNGAGMKLNLQIVTTETDKKSSGFTPAEWRNLGPYVESIPLRAGEKLEKVAPNKQGTEFESLRRELSVNGNMFQGYKADYTPDGVSQIRPTDLLHVMAIGATHVPLDIDGVPLEVSANVPDMMKQWTTSAEALAIAMGYGDRAKYDYYNSLGQGAQTDLGPLAWYYFDLNTTDATKVKPLFDGGYLKLDDFVAVRYDSSDNPYTAGSGAPIAGNVLSMFRVHPNAFASLNIATPGVVNINTAPQAVLRVLPMTFPSTNQLLTKSTVPPIDQQPATFWAGADETERAREAVKTDVAAMIESYRDKIAVELRPKAKGTSSAGESSMPGWFAGFFDRTKAGFAAPSDQDVDPNDTAIGDYSNIVNNPTTYKGGRYWSTGIKGLREGAGFRSPGELLAVKQIEFDPSNNNAVTTVAADLEKRTSNIDFLGYRSTPSNMLGTDNILEQVLNTADPPVVTDVRPLQFGKTYQDKLKILSGLLGSISVRSDMYAVWFIARGYQRSDVEGLPALQPMVPSVERRFLMIIDRSNVTKVGQKPRILSFVELPL